MKDEHIKVFEQLLEDETFKGKKQLRHLLWLNTVAPKFKVGDCFEVSESGRKVYGYPIKNFSAKVIRVYSYTDHETWYYELESEVVCGGKKTTVTVFQPEDKLQKAKRCENNKNTLGEH